jgi:CRP/FNR family cyclic AMP-dependent transcriptional regulator
MKVGDNQSIMPCAFKSPDNAPRLSAAATAAQNLTQFDNAEFVPLNHFGSNELRAQDGLRTHLKKQALLKACSEQLIHATADAARVSDIETGNYACLQGDANAPLIMVLRGQLRSCYASEDGDEIPLQTVGGGESIGEAAIIGDVPMPVNVVATRGSTIATLSRVRARQLFAEPEMLRALSFFLAEQVRGFAQRCTQQSLPRAAARISAVIASEISGTDDRVVSGIELPSQATIAAMANVSRETVSRVLASLERRGVIAKQGRRISIRDRAALRAIAMG